MSKVYFYKSSIDVEYYWYKDVHLVIQDFDETFPHISPYAKVYSETTRVDKNALNALQDSDNITEVPIDIFKSRLIRAFEIITQKIEI